MGEKRCKEVVAERAQGLCELCGNRSSYVSYHHRLKRSQGGQWNPENVVRVDGSGTTLCHGQIEANPNDAADIGFHVRPWEKPEDKPILLHGHRWVKLSTCKPDYHSINDEGDK